jgi:hypothetical protein
MVNTMMRFGQLLSSGCELAIGVKLQLLLLVVLLLILILLLLLVLLHVTDSTDRTALNTASRRST